MLSVKQIPNYQDYLVSENGDIFSKKWGYWNKLKQEICKRNYRRIALSKDGKVKHIFVHKLVLITFDRMPNAGEVCRHLDGNSSNNYYKNLKWGTHQENMDDMWKVHKTANQPENEKNGSCKFSNKQVIKMRKLWATEKYTKTFLANKFNISRAQLRDIVNNKCRKLINV